MVNSFIKQGLLEPWQQLSPSLVLVSVFVHSLLFAIPISSSSDTKYKPSQIATVKQESKPLPLSTSTELFSETKTLVAATKFTDKLSLPTTAPIVLPLSPPPPPTPKELTTITLTTVSLSPPLPASKELPLLPPPPPVSKAQIPQTPKPPTSTTAVKPVLKLAKSKAVKKRVSPPLQRRVEEANLPKNTNFKPTFISVSTVKPDKFNLQTSEEEAFDRIFISLDQELSLTEDFNFAEPDKFAFYIPGMENLFGTVVGKTPDELAMFVKSKLEAEGFQTSQINTYAGGPLYEVKKNAFSEFITFSPTMEGTGVIIITWKTAPI